MHGHFYVEAALCLTDIASIVRPAHWFCMAPISQYLIVECYATPNEPEQRTYLPQHYILLPVSTSLKAFATYLTFPWFTPLRLALPLCIR
jgi:hypothetical protein